MAIRKNSEKDGAGKGFIGRFFKRFSRVGKILLAVFWFLLGGLVFNLDRSGDIGIFFLKYKKIVPYPFSKFLPGASAPEGAAVPRQTIQGRVIEVYDGDTATVITAHPEAKYRVRFFGIDAPETAMPHGHDAKKALQDKILGKDVLVNVSGVDHYGRAVGRVMLGARYVNLEMVSEGHAWYYADYAGHEYDLAAAEREAKVYRRGLWQEKNPLPPWDYRRSKK